MDVNMVVETFVVVVTGVLGSIAGAFFAALLIGLIHALGISLFPQATLVLVFLTMAVVLALRPTGLLGQPQGSGPKEIAQKFILSSFNRAGRPAGAWSTMIFVTIGALLAGVGLLAPF